MRSILLLLAASLCWYLPLQAQHLGDMRPHLWNDSLFYVIDITSTGIETNYSFDIALEARFDATGDGRDELVLIDRNAEGLPILMRVMDTLTSELMAIDLRHIRQHLVTHDGFTNQEAAALKFEAFVEWTSGDFEVPRVAFFTAEGAPVVYDPSNENVAALSPGTWRTLGLHDFDGDGWLDIVLGDKRDRHLEIHGSRFSPGFSD